MSDEFEVNNQRPRCRHLLSKGMFVNAGVPDDERADDEGYFWCGATHREFGPDNEFCDDDLCRDPARRCYEPPE